MYKRIALLGLSVLAMASLSACGSNGPGSIPKTYQGTFTDSGNRAKLTMTDKEANFVTADVTLTGKLQKISYDVLFKGQAGFLVKQVEGSKELLDVFWVTPDLTTKQEAGGLIYYSTDIVYLQMDIKTKEVQNVLQVVHSRNGRVMLDPSVKQFEMGWPSDSEEYTMNRSSATSVNPKDAGKSNGQSEQKDTAPQPLL